MFLTQLNFAALENKFCPAKSGVLFWVGEGVGKCVRLNYLYTASRADWRLNIIIMSMTMLVLSACARVYKKKAHYTVCVV